MQEYRDLRVKLEQEAEDLQKDLKAQTFELAGLEKKLSAATKEYQLALHKLVGAKSHERILFVLICFLSF